MPILNAQLIFNNMNVSAQVGDIIYYTPTAPQGGFTQGALVNTVMLGPILSITPLPNGTTRIIVEYDDSISSLPANGDFVSFAKDKRVNTSSLLGYYADVKFVNDSTGKIELFAIGSEISESSK
jgi:hypothetical protein